MKKEKNIKKAFLWNMIGSTCYSGSSFLYLLVVTRICGATLAGFFSLSYATAQLLLQVGRYGVRTYQATDLNRKYSFSEYKLSRIITCGLMMLFGIIYSSYSFSGEYIIISIFVIMMKKIGFSQIAGCKRRHRAAAKAEKWNHHLENKQSIWYKILH